MNPATLAKVPAPIPRPAFALWIWERGLTLKEVGDAVGCSYEHVRLITLPFGDARRRVPDEELIRRIQIYTAGAVTLTHWYPPDLRPIPMPAGRPAVLRGARAS